MWFSGECAFGKNDKHLKFDFCWISSNWLKISINRGHRMTWKSADRGKFLKLILSEMQIKCKRRDKNWTVYRRQPINYDTVLSYKILTVIAFESGPTVIRTPCEALILSHDQLLFHLVTFQWQVIRSQLNWHRGMGWLETNFLNTKIFDQIMRILTKLNFTRINGFEFAKKTFLLKLCNFGFSNNITFLISIGKNIFLR